MNKKRSLWIRLLGLMLALLTLTTVLASCSGGKNEPTDTTGGGENEGTTEAPTNDVADLPEDLDFGGEIFTIRSVVQTYAQKEFEAGLNGTLIDQAVYRRNRSIEQDYNCLILNEETVGNTNTNEMLEETKKLVEGGYTQKQILVTAGYQMCRLAINGLLKDVTTMEGIDLEKDYYSQGYNKALSIGTAQYLVTGKMSMAYYRYMLVMFYNRDLFAAAGIEDAQDVVLNGEWTFEKAAEFAEDLYVDTGDESTSTYGYYCFVGSGSSQTDGFMSAVDMQVLSKDENNYFKIDANFTRISTAMDKILGLLYSSGSVVSTKFSNQGTVDVFCEGRAAMINYRLFVVENSEMIKRGQTGRGYGLLPIPKMDSTQDDYVSYVQDQCFLFGFLTILDDVMTQKVGWFFEAYASESYRVTKETYYEKALTLRYMDIPSIAIMEIIDTNVYIDPLNVYLSSAFSFTTETLRNIYGDPTNYTITQYLAKYITGGKLQEQVDDLNDVYKELQGVETGNDD